jgi:hypothetical protein
VVRAVIDEVQRRQDEERGDVDEERRREQLLATAQEAHDPAARRARVVRRVAIQPHRLERIQWCG